MKGRFALDLANFHSFPSHYGGMISMPGKAAKVTLTERQREILIELRDGGGVSPYLRQRAAIILLAFEGLRNNEIAEEVALGQRFVGRWRRRWARGWSGLVDVECGQATADLRRSIERILTDRPRSGARPKFTAEQVERVLAVAREPAEVSGRESAYWSAHGLAAEVVRRGIVASISASQVRRYLREADLLVRRRGCRLDRTEKVRRPGLTTLVLQTTN
jgi:transposase